MASIAEEGVTASTSFKQGDAGHAIVEEIAEGLAGIGQETLEALPERVGASSRGFVARREASGGR